MLYMEDLKMPCYSPITGYMSKKLSENGKRYIVFNPKDGYIDKPMTIPCGQCIGCRLEKSRQWAIRCVHEASLHKNNAFITLTYNNENLPKDGSINKREMQLFMKRLRKQYGEGIRFYGAGEYGDLLGRPHYHIIVFNIYISDLVLISIRQGIKLYKSETLAKIWPFGYSSVGEVTFESAAYVARYVTKKITGNQSKDYYKGREPEFALMSRKPGIGHDWIEKYYNDVYVQDQLIMRNGKAMKPPKYYDSIYDKITGNLTILKSKRKLKSLAYEKDNTEQRRKDRLDVLKTKIKKLKRSFESQ